VGGPGGRRCGAWKIRPVERSIKNPIRTEIIVFYMSRMFPLLSQYMSDRQQSSRSPQVGAYLRVNRNWQQKFGGSRTVPKSVSATNTHISIFLANIRFGMVADGAKFADSRAR
jgi:hypothetical protein